VEMMSKWKYLIEEKRKSCNVEEFESEKTVTINSDPSVKALTKCEESILPQFYYYYLLCWLMIFFFFV
jgi:hypothetical protein